MEIKLFTKIGDNMADNNKNYLGLGFDYFDNASRSKPPQYKRCDPLEEQIEKLKDLERNKINDEIDKRQRLEDIAEHTAETNIKLDEIVQQLAILEDIFSVDADALEVEREIRELVSKQLPPKHPIKELLLDKGGGLALSMAQPFIYNAIKSYLESRGFHLP